MGTRGACIAGLALALGVACKEGRVPASRTDAGAPEPPPTAASPKAAVVRPARPVPLSASERQVLTAVLAAKIEEVRSAHPRGPLSSVCLASYTTDDDEWLRPDALAELRDDLQATIGLPVTLLGEECLLGPDASPVDVRGGFLIDRKTGLPAASVSVTRPVRDADGVRRFSGSIALGGLWGHGFRCDLVIPGFEPKRHCRMTWIS